MKVHRFIGIFDFAQDRVVLDDVALVHQITNVLHLRVGEHVMLCDGQGHDVDAVITRTSGLEVEVQIETVHQNTNEPTQQVTLYCAVLKKENFDLVVQKAVEVGVSEIIPVISARTVKQQLRYDRLAKIMREATEQSGRGRVPTFHEAFSFRVAIAHAGTLGSFGTRQLFFDSSGVRFQSSTEEKIGIWIGPEGGWTSNEIIMARDAGFTITTLGPRTLRAETAAIVAGFLATHFSA